MDAHALLGLLQWPAMAVSLFGSWWTGDPGRSSRHLGFAVLMVSNVIWLVWAVTDHAWALLVMQAAFLLLNGRGFFDNRGRT